MEAERIKLMNTFYRLATSSAMFLLLSSPAVMHAQYAPQQGNAWNAPSEFNDAQRHGYQDGIEGARKDYENHRQPNVNNRDEYRHPNVSKGLRHDYREGFQRGYDDGVRHTIAAK
jgi:ribosome modulation factor